MASCEPMASPSGRTWDEMTKRRRCRISSVMRSRTDVSLVVVVIRYRRGGFVGMKVAQDLLDPVLALDRLVEPEFELRNAAQPQAPADVPPHERRGAIQRPRRLPARFLIAERRVVDARELQVGRHRHAGERDEADAGIVDRAAAQQLAQLVAYLFTDAVGTVAHRSNGALPETEHVVCRARCPSV